MEVETIINISYIYNILNIILYILFIYILFTYKYICCIYLYIYIYKDNIYNIDNVVCIYIYNIDNMCVYMYMACTSNVHMNT